MGEVVGAGLLAHVPTIMLPEADRRELNNGQEISLVPGLHDVTLSPGVSVAQALTAYRNNPAVQYAEADISTFERIGSSE